MAVQPWICFLVAWLTSFNFSDATISSSEPSPAGELIDKHWWRAPPPQTTGPLCIAEEVKQNSPAAHDACAAECTNISERADIIFAKYSQTIPAAEIVSRQCSGFTHGICKNHFLGYFPMCWCRAKDFQQISTVCQKFVLEWIRIFLNTKTRAVKLYDASVKPQLAKLRETDLSSIPFLGRAKAGASYLWDSSVRPRLPAKWAGGGSSLPSSPKARSPMHGPYDENVYPGIQGRFEHDEFASQWPPQQGGRAYSPARSQNGTPINGLSDEYRDPNILGQFKHDEFASGWPPKKGSRSNSPTRSQNGMPMQGLYDQYRDPNIRGQFKHDEFASEWPPQKGGRPNSPAGQRGAEKSAHDDFLGQLEDEQFGSELGPPQNENTHFLPDTSMHDQSGEFLHNYNQYESGDLTTGPWPPEEGDIPHSGAQLHDTPLHGTQLYDTPLRGTPSHGTPLRGTPRPNSPKPSSPRPSSPRPSSPRSSSPRPSSPQPSLPEASAPRPSSPKPRSPRPSPPRVSSPLPVKPMSSKPNDSNNDGIRGQSESNKDASEQSPPPNEIKKVPSQPPVSTAPKQGSKEVSQPAPLVTSTAKKQPKKSKFSFNPFKCCFKGKKPIE